MTYAMPSPFAVAIGVYGHVDRLLLNGLIQPFQQPERVLGFFNTYRDGKRVTRRTLTESPISFSIG
jgi:hypothetical protein